MRHLPIGRQHIPVLATLAVLVLILVFGAVRHADSNFAGTYNLLSLLRGGAVLGIAAIGATLVILSKGIDLSVGALVALTTTTVAAMVSSEIGPGIHPALAVPAALAIGTLFGTAQGCLIHFFRLPPFLVTLAGMFLARGLAFAIHPQSIAVRHDALEALQNIGVPVGRFTAPLAVILLITLYAIAIAAARLTTFAREVYAIGGDEPSARLMGISVGRTKIGVYALAGLCASLAGVVSVIDTGSGSPAEFVGFELDAIAAVVIGGTLLTGGVGFVAGTLMGVLILGLIRLIIDYEGNLSSWWTNISAGALLFVFILLQTLLVRLAKKR